MNVSQKLKLS